MSRRLALALITLAAGAGLLAAAALGSGARVSSGGIFEVGDTGNLDSVDPAIANETTSWMFEAATGAKLVRADPSLLTVLAMPFFQAASSKLPLTREAIGVQQVGDLPTAGPYTWSYNAPNQQANIVRNPYYTGTRGRHVDGVELDMQLD